MSKKISQKSFDSQLHIIRDARFDVDKYKLGELYVINNSSKHIDDNVWHINLDKVVGILKYVHEKFLSFQVLRYYEHDNTVSYNSSPLRIDIDDIIDKQIEIERLLTETEAAIYLSGILIEEENRRAFDNIFGFKATPDDIATAYKIDTKTAEECIDFGEMAKDVLEEDPNIIDRDQYVCYLPTRKRPVSFINENGTFAHELFNGYESSLKVTMTKGDSEISIKTSVKNLKVDTDTIAIRNGNHTVSVKLHKDSFYKIYDNIKFEP